MGLAVRPDAAPADAGSIQVLGVTVEREREPLDVEVTTSAGAVEPRPVIAAEPPVERPGVTTFEPPLILPSTEVAPVPPAPTASIESTTTVTDESTSPLPATSPESSPTVAPATPPPSTPESIGLQAQARLSYDVAVNLPGWEIAYLPGRAAVRGLSFPSTERIEIYVRDGDTVDVVARVLAHEVGHAVDLSLNSQSDRDEWRAARGVGDEAPWWPNASSADFDTLAGDFAEAFATWQVGSPSRSTVAGPFNAEQIALVARLAMG